MYKNSNIKPHLVLGVALLALGFSVPAAAQSVIAGQNVSGSTEASVPAVPMSAAKNIIENITLSKDHTTLVSAIKAADLTGALSGTGPFTLFAPTNDAFAKLPPGTVENLLKVENKARLAGILNYHVVPGRLTSASLEAMADENGGRVTLKTAQGGDLTVLKGEDDLWWVTDSSGNRAQVKTADLNQSNGVIFVIDTVLMPHEK